MPSSDIESLYIRLRALEAEHRKAEHYRDRWAMKAAKAQEKLNAFRLVCDDLGLEAPARRPGAGGPADGVTAATRNAVNRCEVGSIITPDDLRPHMGDFRDVPTHLITKALTRMTHEEVPLIGLDEAGRGQRQSRYLVLNTEAVVELGEGDDSEADSAESVREVTSRGV